MYTFIGLHITLSKEGHYEAIICVNFFESRIGKDLLFWHYLRVAWNCIYLNCMVFLVTNPWTFTHSTIQKIWLRQLHLNSVLDLFSLLCKERWIASPWTFSNHNGHIWCHSHTPSMRSLIDINYGDNFSSHLCTATFYLLTEKYSQDREFKLTYSIVLVTT